jgi:hypothetical protein
VDGFEGTVRYILFLAHYTHNASRENDAKLLFPPQLSLSRLASNHLQKALSLEHLC